MPAADQSAWLQIKAWMVRQTNLLRSVLQDMPLRWVVSAVVATALIFPAFHWYGVKKTELHETKSLQAWIKRHPDQLHTLLQRDGYPDKTIPPPELFDFATQSFPVNGITPDRMEPRDNELSIWASGVPFEAFLDWTAHAHQSGVQIQSLIVDRSPEPGIVNIAIVLARENVEEVPRR